MKIIHTYIKFVDLFSGAEKVDIRTLSELTFERAKNQIGETKRVFDESSQIAFLWKLVEVRQATQSDYKQVKNSHTFI